MRSFTTSVRHPSATDRHEGCNEQNHEHHCSVSTVMSRRDGTPSDSERRNQSTPSRRQRNAKIEKAWAQNMSAALDGR